MNLPHLLQRDFPDSSVGKESCNARDPGSIPGLGRCPGERKGYPLQYSGLENSMDCIVPGVAKSWTRLSNFHFHCQETLSNIWRQFWLQLGCGDVSGIQWAEARGAAKRPPVHRTPTMTQGYPAADVSNARQVALVAKNLLPVQVAMQVWSPGGESPWKRAWQPTPVFLPGDSRGQRSLGGYRP